ncbi:RDD family protein [Kribbella sp. NPDC048915]|uniref:RDD family protein n=1 Tax=Kribbella sp. NPDC048915 TaxID=3155148 RepID=UPI0033F9CB07
MTTPPSGPHGPQYGPQHGPQYGPQYGQPIYTPPPGYGYGYGGQLAPLASWGARVGASLVDALVSGIPAMIGYAVFIANALSRSGNTYPDDEPEPWAILAFVLGFLITLALGLWNRVFRQGRTGQSVGKSVLKIRLVDMQTAQPIGAGRAFLRDFVAGVFNNACFLNVLWPLWDEQHQTWHDKVINTYVVKDVGAAA